MCTLFSHLPDLLSSSIILLMNDSYTTMELSMEYLNIIFLGSVFVFIQMAVNSSLSAMGDTKTNRNVLIVSFFFKYDLEPLVLLSLFCEYKLGAIIPTLL